MIAFDLFKDVVSSSAAFSFYRCILSHSTQSLKVRSNYINHLRDLGIIETHFIPTVFSLLKLYDGFIKTFKLDIWAVEEYHVDRKNILLL
jgi:hypothetical protein